jgi:hypothetical protein
MDRGSSQCRDVVVCAEADFRADAVFYVERID